MVIYYLSPGSFSVSSAGLLCSVPLPYRCRASIPRKAREYIGQGSRPILVQRLIALACWYLFHCA